MFYNIKKNGRFKKVNIIRPYSTFCTLKVFLLSSFGMSVNISSFSFFCSDCLDPFLSRRFRLTLQYKVDGFYCKFSNWLWIKFILDLWLKAHSINNAAIQLKLRSFYGLKLFKFDKLLFFNFLAYPAYLYKTNLRYV